ncbi:MAG: ATP phosphoribosyltransferase [Acidobacteriota bacterium]|nr:ATP phosphoribosyltransferase [Acidobacteriota bacterium]
MTSVADGSCTLAAPRNRFLSDILDLLDQVGVRPEETIRRSGQRRYRFGTNEPELDLVLARNADIAMLVNLGAVELGIVGSDIFIEQQGARSRQEADSVSAMDLGLGRCRLSLLAPPEVAACGLGGDGRPVRVATTYPRIATAYFATFGQPVECIKLHGCVEIAPGLGLADYVMDLVSSGRTSAQNGLVEVEEIMPISTHLVVHRPSGARATAGHGVASSNGTSPGTSSWVLRFAERLGLRATSVTGSELLERALRRRPGSAEVPGLTRGDRPSLPNSSSSDVPVPASPCAAEPLRSGD